MIAFLVEADKLKSILRRTPLADASRLENSAEHSWHLALAAMVLTEYAPAGQRRRVLELVVHDLVEVDAGDTFAYDPGHIEVGARAGGRRGVRPASGRAGGASAPWGGVRGAPDARGAVRQRARPVSGAAAEFTPGAEAGPRASGGLRSWSGWRR